VTDRLGQRSGKKESNHTIAISVIHQRGTVGSGEGSSQTARTSGKMRYLIRGGFRVRDRQTRKGGIRKENPNKKKRSRRKSLTRSQ